MIAKRLGQEEESGGEQQTEQGGPSVDTAGLGLDGPIQRPVRDRLVPGAEVAGMLRGQGHANAIASLKEAQPGQPERAQGENPGPPGCVEVNEREAEDDAEPQSDKAGHPAFGAFRTADVASRCCHPRSVYRGRHEGADGGHLVSYEFPPNYG